MLLRKSCKNSLSATEDITALSIELQSKHWQACWLLILKKLVGSSAVGQGYSKTVPLLMVSVKCPEKLRFLPCCDVSYHIASNWQKPQSAINTCNLITTVQSNLELIIPLYWNVLMSQMLFQYYQFSTLLSEVFVQVVWYFPFHLILFSSSKRCNSCSPVLRISLKS